MDLKNKRILVTGGAGFVGSHIIDLLLDEGCSRVYALDNLVRGNLGNLAPALASSRVEFVQGDIRDRALVDRLVGECDVVFHQAALRIIHCAAEPRQAMEVMVNATFDLLESCVKHRIEKVVAASSASIYGLAETFPTTEGHHPYANRTLYGAAKQFNEGLLSSFNDMYGLDYAALRYFNVYGPRMDIHGKYTEVLIRWMDRIAAGQPPVIFGDGLQTMDFVHVRDVARANILAARTDFGDAEPSGRVFNVASGIETSLLQLAQATARVMGRPDLVPVHEEERKINPVSRRLASTDLARRVLGFETSISLEEGLAGLVAWWQSQKVDAA
ncbi:SDR family NAD(P)-dependent oxidoreductase [Azospirillum canadense]|uniref:SDR family NAD(P)-dependent oxidoreductase n=1 Tax=Azospirillum canadense TaxID=403962 RepID=UPI0022280611|nr:SDR family NAD(P)-dependent oxidoreductase [Azospirillum canadense]MCW2238563.1 UDP-glucose 4-epimerase [Azospirillum canadense]